MALAYGSRGDDVLKYQQQLQQAGYDPKGLDGIWGKNTEAAHQAYTTSLQKAPTSLAGPTAAPTTDPTAGLVGLRNTAERAGATVGWSPDTGPTLNGSKIDTSGMTLHNQNWYGKPEDIYGMLATSKAPEYNMGGGMFSPEDMQGLVQKILNPEAFSFDETNPMFSSMMGQAERTGEKAFNNNIANLTALSGGRLNSWAAGQASQAREGATQEIMPQLYQLAYGMWNDQQDRHLTNMNALMGLDNTMYGRSRDSYGDMLNAANTGLGIQDQKYNRGIDERNYGRDVFESDRNYSRGVLESDRNYGLQAAQERRIASGSSSKASSSDISSMGTQDQVDAYYQFLDSFGGGGFGTYKGKPTEAYNRLVSNRGQIEKMIGTKLYTQLLADVKGLISTVGDAKAPAEPTAFNPSKDPVAQRAISMMGETVEAPGANPYQTIKQPKHDTQAIIEYVFANVADDDQAAQILNYLGIK